MEIGVQLQDYNLRIMESWWGDSHDWSAAMRGYGLFRKDRPRRQGGGLPFM